MDTKERIEARLAEIKAAMSALTDEVSELETALRVIRRLGHGSAPSAVTCPKLTDLAFQLTHAQEQRERERLNTIRDYVYAVLQDGDIVWATANQIQVLASKRRGSEIPMTSISPTLSLMKAQGILVRKGLHVALATRAKMNEAPGALAPEPHESFTMEDQTGAG
jgi:hypothetical protein